MTKLEELTVLLVNEINDFNNGLEKLDQINTQLKDMKIKMDLTEYKAIIESHQQKMETHLNVLKSFENRFDSKINQTKIYLNWVIVVFIANLVFGITYIFLK